MKEEFKTILDSMSTKGEKPTALLALLKMDDLNDKWTVVYADESSSLTNEQKNAIFSRLLEEIKKKIQPEELNQIARIGIFTVKDHLVQSLLHYKTGAIIKGEKVNGNFIHEGYIIKGAVGEFDNKVSSPSNDDLDKKSTTKDNVKNN